LTSGKKRLPTTLFTPTTHGLGVFEATTIPLYFEPYLIVDMAVVTVPVNEYSVSLKFAPCGLCPIQEVVNIDIDMIDLP
jgi:hypothetical protein